MRVRDAFESLVLPNCRESPATIQNNRQRMNRWERFSGNPRVADVGTDTFRRYREECQSHALSADTIESDVRTVMLCLRMAARLGKIPAAPWPGVPLRKRRSPKPTPTLDDVGRCYAKASVATWPTHCDPGAFWRAWYAVALWTGLRRSDLFWGLQWAMVAEDAIRCTARKTGRSHVFPMHPVVWRHLQTLPRTSATVFGVRNSLKQIRRELTAIQHAAGVKSRVQPQELRRLSISCWEECAGAGRLIHGCSCDVVTNHYLVLTKPPKQLADGVESFRWPDAMLLPEERGREKQAEFRALRILRRMRAGDAETWLKTGERMVS